MKDIKNRNIKNDSSLINKFNGLFEDKSKRYLVTFLCILPFLVLIGVFGYLTYKEAKNLLDLAKGPEEIVVEDNPYAIPSTGYTLRDNATDIQLEYFGELKQAIQSGSASAEDMAGLIGKNYVADFYTWTNKQGQYDVGGMLYVCSEKSELGKFRDNAYLKARDGFYKYLNEYIKQYKKENLIEVDNVTIVSSKKADYEYILHQFTGIEVLEDGETCVDVFENVGYDCYDVKLSWTYKPNSELSLSDFANSINLLVINNDGVFEIAEASEKTIDARDIPQEDEEEEIEDTAEEEKDEKQDK